MKKRKLSLSRSLIIIIAICWLVPLGAVAFAMTLYYYNGMVSKINDMMKAELTNLSTIISVRLDEAITLSKKVTYDGAVDDMWNYYESGHYTSIDFRREITGMLKNSFSNDSRFVMAAFYTSALPGNIYHSLPGTEEFNELYTDEVRRAAENITKNEGSGAILKIVDERIFVIRNLFSPSLYKKYGTLIIELDKDELLQLASGMEEYDIQLFIDGVDQSIGISEGESSRSGIHADKQRLINALRQNISRSITNSIMMAESGKYQGFVHQKSYKEYHLASMLVIDAQQAHAELQRITRLLVLLIGASLPVLLLVMWMMKKHISRPMKVLTEGYERLEEREFGVQLDVDGMPNSEFANMTVSFNRLSERLDYLFDFAYREKLARRDAAIIALQSRINPHFLNNTLEMMNWQARLSGDVSVSRMIEALSTLLDYSMDRSNKKLIYVSEELRCADAYFYIISMRYGQRLNVEKDIDQSLLQCEVPRLILQPLLENAVVHGIEKQNQGTIRLRIYREKDELVLKVNNTGKVMTPETQREIEAILADTKVEDLATIEIVSSSDGLAGSRGKTETVTANVRNGRVSIGIRNVNERIKLIYGNQYGLSIICEENKETAAIIRIPLDGWREDKDA